MDRQGSVLVLLPQGPRPAEPSLGNTSSLEPEPGNVAHQAPILRVLPGSDPHHTLPIPSAKVVTCLGPSSAGMERHPNLVLGRRNVRPQVECLNDCIILPKKCQLCAPSSASSSGFGNLGDVVEQEMVQNREPATPFWPPSPGPHCFMCRGLSHWGPESNSFYRSQAKPYTLRDLSCPPLPNYPHRGPLFSQLSPFFPIIGLTTFVIIY